MPILRTETASGTGMPEPAAERPRPSATACTDIAGPEQGHPGGRPRPARGFGHPADGHRPAGPAFPGRPAPGRAQGRR